MEGRGAWYIAHPGSVHDIGHSYVPCRKILCCQPLIDETKHFRAFNKTSCFASTRIPSQRRESCFNLSGLVVRFKPRSDANQVLCENADTGKEMPLMNLPRREVGKRYTVPTSWVRTARQLPVKTLNETSQGKAKGTKLRKICSSQSFTPGTFHFDRLDLLCVLPNAVPVVPFP